MKPSSPSHVTIIGSRDIPKEQYDFLKEMSHALSSHGVIIRTGNAVGADEAARVGCVEGMLEAYHPNDVLNQPKEVQRWLWNRVKQFHPAPEKLRSDFVKMLMMRNLFQLFSIDGVNKIVENRISSKEVKEQPFTSNFVICYTDRGLLKGGTSFAIRVAELSGLRVYNIGREEDYHFMRSLLSDLMHDRQEGQLYLPEKLGII